MLNKYYDKWEFDQAFDLRETNPIESKRRYEAYLEKYPNDYSTYPCYAYVLITLGEFENAINILNYVEEKYIMDEDFLTKNKKFELIKQNIFYNRLRALSYMEKYDELYAICSGNPEKIAEMDLNTLDFYCKAKLGLLSEKGIDKYSYLFRQMVNYCDDEFVEHIKKHLADYNCVVDDPKCSCFISGFPINLVIDEVKKNLLSDKRLFAGFFHDMYVFRYDNCGRIDNKPVNYFVVICLHNTKNIITMYPSLNCNNLPQVDFNHLNYNNVSAKVRKISQIDKFNARFEMK